MRSSGLKKHLFLSLGWLFAGLGFVGIFLPLLPTTVFWIVAVDMFVRSDPSRAEFLLRHPRFGPGLRAWFERGAIGRAPKIAATPGIAGSYSFMLWGFWGRATMLALIGLVLAGVLLFIWTRPED